MWKSGYSSAIDRFYSYCKVDNVTASLLNTFVCDYVGRLSTTQCTNDTVNWVKGDYNFIIWGPDWKYIEEIQFKCMNIINRRC